MTMQVAEKSRELAALGRSVITPRAEDASLAMARAEPNLTYIVAQAGELITPWGRRPKARDIQLRGFWPTEFWLSTTLGMISARNAAFDWVITGDEQTAEAAHEMVNNANFGGGWEEFITQTTIDLETQDSGAFVELIRNGDTEDSPVIGFAHLDAGRCWPTGVPEWPVLYETIDHKFRLMPWYSVVQLLEMPDPQVFSATGFFYKLQHCAVSRLFRAAQILKNISIYTEEKTGGRYTRGVHLIGGFSQSQIETALVKAQNDADAGGLMRFIRMPMISAINPEQKIDHKLLEIASLPDGWEESEAIKNYITLLAIAFGVDYQDIAPLPGGNLGTGSQSEVLDRKSKGKGAALFQKLITRLMNGSVLPNNVQFEFAEVDLEDEEQQAQVRKTRAEERQVRIDSGELLPIEARQIAVDEGDLSLELFEENKDQFPAEAEEPAAPPRNIDETVEGDEEPSSPDDESRVGERAAGPVTFGKLLSSRIHRAYSTVSDDVHGLGYFEDTAQRKQVATLIGPVLARLEVELRRANLFDIELEPEDADRIVDMGLRELAAGMKEEERAGPDDARLDFEEDLAQKLERGMSRVQTVLNAGLRSHANNGAS